VRKTIIIGLVGLALGLGVGFGLLDDPLPESPRQEDSGLETEALPPSRVAKRFGRVRDIVTRRVRESGDLPPGWKACWDALLGDARHYERSAELLASAPGRRATLQRRACPKFMGANIARRTPAGKWPRMQGCLPQNAKGIAAKGPSD